jgi:hypothetical protein
MNAEPAKHEGVCWVDVAEIPQAMVRSSMQALRCYLDGGPFLSLHGWSERCVATSP